MNFITTWAVMRFKINFIFFFKLTLDYYKTIKVKVKC